MTDLDPFRSGMSNDLPPELWIGKIDHQWPLYVWSSPEQARTWLTEPSDPTTNYHRNKRLWHITVGHAQELTLTTPEPPQLIPIEAPKPIISDDEPMRG